MITTIIPLLLRLKYHKTMIFNVAHQSKTLTLDLDSISNALLCVLYFSFTIPSALVALSRICRYFEPSSRSCTVNFAEGVRVHRSLK